MNRNCHVKPVVLVTVVVLAAASVVAWRSVAAQPGDARAEPWGPGSPAREAAALSQATPVPGGPGFYMQSSVAFRPSSSTTEWAYGVRELYNPGLTPGTYYSSPSLPNGATITKLVVYYYDDCAGVNPLVNLLLCGGAGEMCDVMAAVSSSSDVGGYGNSEDSTIHSPVIDQQSWVYIVSAELPGGCGSSLRLVNIRIDYGFGSRLPIVTKD